MFDLFKTVEDIPGSEPVRLSVWAFRLLRKIPAFQRFVLDMRLRSMLGTTSRLHINSVHEMRTFSLQRYMATGIKATSEHPYQPFKNLASANCSVFAELLGVSTQHLHCTIKICNTEENVKKKDWKVYTIARSASCNRPKEFFPDAYHLVGNNSSFAPLVGCNDRKNTWIPHVYHCFVCNDLTKHFDKYDCSRKNWCNYFKSTAVFPLRYSKGRESHTIIGFLTLDSDKTNVFCNIPDIFDYKDSPEDYLEKLSFSTVYHIGGIIADTLATTFYLQEAAKGEE